MCDGYCVGHVERTNDRDYEIEERYVCSGFGGVENYGVLTVDED